MAQKKGPRELLFPSVCLQHIKSMAALDSDFSFDQSSVMRGGNTNGYSVMTVGNRGEDTDSDLGT